MDLKDASWGTLRTTCNMKVVEKTGFKHHDDPLKDLEPYL